MTVFSRQHLAAALAFGAVSLVGSPVMAQEELKVQVSVKNTCTISGGTINFGEYTNGQSEDLDATGTISFENCSGSTVLTSLSAGSSGNVNDRKMINGADTLNYQLYTDEPRNFPWVDHLEGISGAGVNVLTVYGRIPGDQMVLNTGAYEDTLTITMTFN